MNLCWVEWHGFTTASFNRRSTQRSGIGINRWFAPRAAWAARAIATTTACGKRHNNFALWYHRNSCNARVVGLLRASHNILAAAGITKLQRLAFLFEPSRATFLNDMPTALILATVKQTV